MTDENSSTATQHYRRFRDILGATASGARFADYKWGNLPVSLSPIWMPYALMFDEFSREIANSINQLVSYSHRLKAWSEVVREFDEQQKLEALNEFIEPIATTALNLPFVIRSRFIFAIAHLAHQAKRATEGPAWKDDFPLDKEIGFGSADKYGGDWKSYVRLKRSLENISSKKYQEATNDFRNKYNHRFSPRVLVGFTGLVTRIVGKAGQVSYQFGEQPPLSLDVAAELLNQQCETCFDAFSRFKAFIAELEQAIRAYPPSKTQQ